MAAAYQLLADNGPDGLPARFLVLDTAGRTLGSVRFHAATGAWLTAIEGRGWGRDARSRDAAARYVAEVAMGRPLTPEHGAPCGRRRPLWERPGVGLRRLPCVRPDGHDGDHADAVGGTWPGESGNRTHAEHPQHDEHSHAEGEGMDDAGTGPETGTPSGPETERSRTPGPFTVPGDDADAVADDLYDALSEALRDGGNVVADSAFSALDWWLRKGGALPGPWRTRRP